MSPNSPDIVQKIRLEPDAAAAARTAQVLQLARQQIVDVGGGAQSAKLQFDNAAQAAQQLGLSASQLTQLSAQEAQATANARELASSLDTATQSAGALAQKSSGININSGRQIVGQAGGLLSAAGGGAGQAGSALSSILALTETLGPFGVAAGAAVLVLRNVTEAEQKRAQAAKEYIAAVQATAGSTTEDIQKQIVAQKQQRDSAQEAQDALKGYQSELAGLRTTYGYGQANAQAYNDAVAELNARIYDATGGASGWKDGVGKMIYSTNDFNAAIGESQQAVDAANGKIAFLNTQLNTQAVAANNAAAAAERYAQQQVDYAQQEIRVEGMTKSQREERIAAIARETTILREQIDANEGNLTAQNALADQIAALSDEYQALTHVTTTYADALEAEKRAKQSDIDASNTVNDGLSAMADLQKQLAQATETVTKTYQDLLDAQTQHSANVQQIEDNKNDAIEKAQAQAAKRIEDIQAQSDARIAQLKAQDNLSIEQAVASGNQAQAQQILAQQKLKIDTEKQNAKDQKKQAKDAADDAIDAAKKQAQKLLDQEQTRYDKERAQREAAYAKALADQKTLNDAIELQRSINAFREQYWAGVVTSAYDQLHDAQQQANYSAQELTVGLNSLAFALSFANSSIGFGGGKSGAVPTFDSGGVVTRPGWAYLGVIGERYYPPAGRAALSSGPSSRNVTVNVDARGSSIPEGQWREWGERVETRIVTRLTANELAAQEGSY